MGLTSNTGLYNAAAEHYGVDDSVMTKIPRQKFQFMIGIHVNETVPLISEPVNGRRFMFHRVQSASLPDYNYNLVKVNQYNRMRYIPTRLDYAPVTIVFYDTIDNEFQYLLQAYSGLYFNQGMNLDATAARDSSMILPGPDIPFGALPVATPQRYFFEQIDITTNDSPNNQRVISMYNCMISTVNHDRLDYSDSNPVLWTVQFQPEHVNINNYSNDPNTGTDTTNTQTGTTTTQTGT